jgi:hypothetical protein
MVGTQGRPEDHLQPVKPDILDAFDLQECTLSMLMAMISIHAFASLMRLGSADSISVSATPPHLAAGCSTSLIREEQRYDAASGWLRSGVSVKCIARYSGLAEMEVRYCGPLV